MLEMFGQRELLLLLLELLWVLGLFLMLGMLLLGLGILLMGLVMKKETPNSPIAASGC